AGLNPETLSRIYGHEMGSYLGYAPGAFQAFLLPLLSLTPALLLLTCVEGKSAIRIRGTRAITALALRVLLGWGGVNALGLSTLTALLEVRYGHGPSNLDWAARLWLSIVFSGLSSIGLSVLIATCFSSRRSALLVGLPFFAVLGYLGILGRALAVTWLPGAVDQSLFAGVGSNWAPAAIVASTWLAVSLLIAIAVSYLRNRSARADLAAYIAP
ncbi:MAG: hypothetical protein ABI627_15520, partial [Polyangiaceae bacterium]